MIKIMSQGLIEFLADIPASERRFGAGAFLFYRDDPVRVLYQVVEGAVHLVRHDEGGGSIILQRAAPGALLAEASLFADTYHCDAVAVGPTRMLVRDKRLVRASLSGDPAVAVAWATYLAHEVQATRLRAEILSLKTVSERIDAWLAANEGRLPSKGKWKSLAGEIGTSPEALYRELAKRRRN